MSLAPPCAVDRRVVTISTAIAIALVIGFPCHAFAQGRWTTETRLPKSTQEISVTGLNNLVWVAAGSSKQTRTNALWSYDPATKAWTSRAPYPGTARDHASLVASGGFLYLMGGVTAWPSPSVATVQRYDPATNTWSALAPLPRTRGAMGVAVINGKIYAAGGLHNGTSVDDFAVYDPATDTWTTLPSMPTARDHLTGAAINGKFYAVGGRIMGQTCSPMNIVEVFDPATSTWSTGPAMMSAHAGHATGVVNGRLQVFGGEGSASNCGTLAQSEEFNPATNTWTALPNMPTPRHGIAGATIGTSVYLPGGATWTGDAPTAVHERYDANGVSTAGPVPSPWTSADIGSVGIAGQAQFDNGVFTIQAAGANVYGTVDSFHFVYAPLPADGEIVAHVEALGNTDLNAKAGVMIRETLAADSRSVILDSKPDDTVEFLTRSATGGATVKIAGGAAPAPIWLKLGRKGTTISASVSVDGAAWTGFGTTTLGATGSVFVGLAVASHQTAKWTSATIDHVSLSSASGNNPPTISLTAPDDNATFTAPATIPLGASASDADGTIARVDFLANNGVIGSVPASPYSATWSNVPAGTYTLTAVAVDNDGAETTSSPVTVTVTAAPPTSLPAPWQSADVGAVGIAGTASFSGGLFSVRGAGADVWGTADAFQYAYQTLSGDGEIVARVNSIESVYQWSKAGVMIRSSLTPGSPYAFMLVSVANGLRFQSRTSANAAAATAIGAASAAPYWVKLVRAGNTIAGFQSANGTAWTQVGSATIALGTSAFVGLAVTSHNTSKAATAVFANVAVSAQSGTSLPSPWTDQDIGAVGKSGSVAYDSGAFTVNAAGANVWGTADSFHYVSQPNSGNVQIVARVTSLLNTNVHAKAGVMLRQTLTASSVYVQLDIEPTGRIEFMSRTATGATAAQIATSTHAFPVWLKLLRSGATITASMSSDGVAWSQVGTTTIGTGTPNVGLSVTSHDVTKLTTAVIDDVTVGNASQDSTPGPISFNRKTIVSGGTSAVAPAVAVPDFTSPTSLTFGPDGKLYVSVMTGQIFIFTLDMAKLPQAGQIAVKDYQVLDNIYVKPSTVCDANGLNCTAQSPPGTGRQVTGLVIAPESTPSNIVLYVTHSGLTLKKNDITLYPFGGAISRLTLRPDPANLARLKVVEDEDLIVGLPRSREAHTLNGMDFGPDGWLYIAVGGNTNAGRPSTFFANLAESYLSASVLRLKPSGLLGMSLPLDMTNVASAADMQPYAGKLELYATGYRNPYDIAWHSNGRLYLNGNAPNLNQGLTPGSGEGCATPSIDVSTRPDTLNIVTPGAYGGHPNPARHECVWGDGKPYNPPLTPEAHYVPPIGKYTYPSANGLVEYTSNAFNGAMKGNLLSAVYAGDQNVRRVVLTADGSGVVSMPSLGQFSNPLDVTADASGFIYVAEFGSSALTVLIPNQMSACPVPGSDPKVTDSDGDGYTDTDEQSNGTDMCSAASAPADFNANNKSDLLDSDDDSDGITDRSDQLFLDRNNGSATVVPLAFEWNPSDGAYGGVAHSGFTGIQSSSRAAADQASGHALIAEGIHPGDAGGHLTMWTYSGTAEGAANDQVNALQVGFNGTTNFRIWSRITQPFTGTTPAVGHVGGVFFGPGEDDYVRLALLGTASGGNALQLGVEAGGTFTEAARINLPLGMSNLDVFLVGAPATHTVTAYYIVNTTGTMKPLGTPVTVPAAWFAKGSASATASLSGLMTSHGDATQMAFVYDFFRIDRAVP